MEARNQVKIKELLAGVKTLDKGDVEGQFYFWKDINARAPGNATYQQERQRIQAKVDGLAPYSEPETAAEVLKAVGRKGAFGNVFIIDITLRNRAYRTSRILRSNAKSRVIQTLGHIPIRDSAGG